MFIKKHEPAILGICYSCRFSRQMAIDFVGRLAYLEQHNGIKHVVDTLKARYAALVARDFARFKMSEGQWIGCWKHFSRMAQRSRRALKQALRVLKCFGLFVHPAPTLKDYEAKRKELLAHDSHKSAEASETLVDHVIDLKYSIKYSTQYPLGTKRAPLNGGIKLAEILISPREHIDSLLEFPSFTRRFYHSLSKLVGKDMPPRTLYSMGEVEHDVAGSAVLLTKDRGYKLRLIANCNRMLQLAVSPLHNYLMSILRVVPESFVYDQDGGALWVSDRLKEGVTLTSLDLKSASDNIPLGPQLALIRDLCPSLDEELQMFHHISRMSWSTPYNKVRWTCGHPMGVNASFGLFTTFLINIFYKVGAEGRFCIVGDDLVFDSIYEHEIVSELGRYSIPVNHAKSLFSDKIFAEFVGRLIDKYGSLDVFKASPYSSKDPLGIVRQYGRKAIFHLGPKHIFGKRSYVEVVDDLRYFLNSKVLAEAIKPYLSPYQVLLEEGHIPPPIHLGGVSKEILGKMAREIAPEGLDPLRKPNATDMNLSADQRLQQKLLHSITNHLNLVQPEHAYNHYIQHGAKQVQAFTVAFNERGAVMLYNRLLQALKRVKSLDEAYEILIQYQTILDSIGIEPRNVRDISRTEKLAKANKQVEVRSVQEPSTKTLYFRLVNAVKRFRKLN